MLKGAGRRSFRPWWIPPRVRGAIAGRRSSAGFVRRPPLRGGRRPGHHQGDAWPSHAEMTGCYSTVRREAQARAIGAVIGTRRPSSPEHRGAWPARAREPRGSRRDRAGSSRCAGATSSAATCTLVCTIRKSSRSAVVQITYIADTAAPTHRSRSARRRPTRPFASRSLSAGSPRSPGRSRCWGPQDHSSSRRGRRTRAGDPS